MWPSIWVRIRRWWCCTSPTGRRLDRSSDLGLRMTAGSSSSHPRRLIASVSRSDPSRDPLFRTSSAGPSEVLISQTTKDLVAGSGLAFQEVGEYELKGVPDSWHLTGSWSNRKDLRRHTEAPTRQGTGSVG